MARNLWRNERRDSLRYRAMLQKLPSPRPAPPPDEPRSPAVYAALAELDEADRELLLPVSWDGLTPAQASRVLGGMPGAARVRLHRARHRFADELAKRSLPNGQTSDERQVREELKP